MLTGASGYANCLLPELMLEWQMFRASHGGVSLLQEGSYNHRLSIPFKWVIAKSKFKESTITENKTSKNAGKSEKPDSFIPGVLTLTNTVSYGSLSMSSKIEKT